MSSRDLRDTVLATFLVALFFVGFAMPIWWFFVYAFADGVTTAMHLVFLAGTLVLMVLSGVLALLVSRPRIPTEQRRGAAAVVCATTVTMFLGVLALGTVISMLNEDQGSITADQPNAPFIVLVVACVAVAAGTVNRAARRVRAR